MAYSYDDGDTLSYITPWRVLLVSFSVAVASETFVIFSRKKLISLVNFVSFLIYLQTKKTSIFKRMEAAFLYCHGVVYERFFSKQIFQTEYTCSTKSVKTINLQYKTQTTYIVFTFVENLYLMFSYFPDGSILPLRHPV